ncbi:MAG TPA: ABC-F family ATP-binding cassette domain-containing protein [Bryobacteraceae bacterium]|nr:ABC-F family ATP-binding cassette domain-containing protein [Bryobacteraceae bacterium]
MLQLSGASKRFAHKLLFEDVDWLVTPNDRVGLVGANGTGKSTVLKILAGLETLDSGERTSTRGLTAGYLPQDGLTLSGRTVFNECLSVFDSVRALEKELEQLTRRMAELDPAGAEYREVAERFHTAENEFRAHDGYSIESQVGAVLSGLGFSKEDWGRPTTEFSGGWQMRIALAKLLLEKPNLLLLDEPTNHLDLEARNWLENYLGSYPYAFVLVSHDRYFLDVTVRKIAELWNHKMHFYAGNFEKYLTLRDERRTQLEAAYKNQQDRIHQLEAFINRFRYQATKAKQVQSRIKELEKIERIEIPDEEEAIHFRFPQPKASGRIVAEFAGVSKSYGEHQVFAGASFIVERGDRVALVGVNGAGKSTLIKILAGAEGITTGEFRLGHNVQVDHFAQDQYKELDPEAQIIDEIASVAPAIPLVDLRNLLGCFLFSGDDVFKKVGVLSGGERNRFALARLLVKPSNFLLLDEPTNHLDMRAKDMLLEALQGYTGTVVFVSHDRYFIDKLATRIFEVADGQVTVFPGNYEDYLWRKAGSPGAPVAAEVIEETSAAPAEPNGAGAGRGRRLNPIKLRQLQDEAATLERKVAALEKEVAALEAELSDYKNPEETMRVSALLETRRGELTAAMEQWENVSTEIEANG